MERCDAVLHYAAVRVKTVRTRAQAPERTDVFVSVCSCVCSVSFCAHLAAKITCSRCGVEMCGDMWRWTCPTRVVSYPSYKYKFWFELNILGPDDDDNLCIFDKFIFMDLYLLIISLLIHFHLNDRETRQRVVNTLIAPQAAGEIGAYQATFDSQAAASLPRTFNNS